MKLLSISILVLYLASSCTNTASLKENSITIHFDSSEIVPLCLDQTPLSISEISPYRPSINSLTNRVFKSGSGLGGSQITFLPNNTYAIYSFMDIMPSSGYSYGKYHTTLNQITLIDTLCYADKLINSLGLVKTERLSNDTTILYLFYNGTNFGLDRSPTIDTTNTLFMTFPTYQEI